MEDRSGSTFYYEWKHAAGSSTFSGRQKGYGTLRSGLYDPSSHVVQWEVAATEQTPDADLIVCRGTLKLTVAADYR